jgi:hypothetical protein
MPQRAALLIEALLLAAVAYAVASVAYLPTHDGPQHIFALHAANHLDAAGTGWQHWLEPNTPLSSYGFGVVFSPLDLWLPWMSAARVALTLMALAWALGVFVFVRAVRPERSWLGVALGATALQWSLYMGFFSFYAAGAFGLFVLAFACKSELRSNRMRALLAALLFLQALLHVMAALQSGLVVAALCGFRAAPGRRLAALLRVALLGAPAAGVAVAVLWVQSAGADLPPGELEAFAFQRPPWWTLGKCLLGGPAWRAWPITLLAAAAPVAALALRGGSRRAEDRALLLAGAAFLAAGAVLPLHLPSWHFFSTRFLPLAACSLVATLPFERVAAPRVRFGLAAALAAFAFASTAWALGHHRDLAARSADALAGLEADLVRDGPRLPIVLDPLLGRPFDNARAAMPYTAPLLNLGKLYAATQGGVAPYSFVSNPAIHPLLGRREARPALETGADPRYALELADPRHAGDLALREAITVFMAAGRGSPVVARLRGRLAARRNRDRPLRGLPAQRPFPARLGARRHRRAGARLVSGAWRHAPVRPGARSARARRRPAASRASELRRRLAALRGPGVPLPGRWPRQAPGDSRGSRRARGRVPRAAQHSRRLKPSRSYSDSRQGTPCACRIRASAAAGIKTVICVL